MRQSSAHAALHSFFEADRKQPVPCDFNMYKWRHLAENFFCDQRFRRVAARYEKTHESLRAMIYAPRSDALAPGNEPLHVGLSRTTMIAHQSPGGAAEEVSLTTIACHASLATHAVRLLFICCALQVVTIGVP
ncbi:transposase [Mesorhizobium sp. L103C119B0]|nr:transposase [Mesorhizobium sp. L103C119B0]